MPYKTTWEGNNRVYFKMYGIVTGSEIEQTSIELFGDPRFDDIRVIIYDFLGIDDFVMSDDELESVAAQDMVSAVTNPYIKIAFITAHPRVIELIKKYDNMSLAPQWKLGIHESIEEANKWCQ